MGNLSQNGDGDEPPPNIESIVSSSISKNISELRKLAIQAELIFKKTESLVLLEDVKDECFDSYELIHKDYLDSFKEINKIKMQHRNLFPIEKIIELRELRKYKNMFYEALLELSPMFDRLNWEIDYYKRALIAPMKDKNRSHR